MYMHTPACKQINIHVHLFNCFQKPHLWKGQKSLNGINLNLGILSYLAAKFIWYRSTQTSQRKCSTHRHFLLLPSGSSIVKENACIPCAYWSLHISCNIGDNCPQSSPPSLQHLRLKEHFLISQSKQKVMGLEHLPTSKGVLQSPHCHRSTEYLG